MQYLYRFYSLPEEDELKEAFRRDKIEFNTGKINISSVLEQYNDKNKLCQENIKFPEPYFSLYKLNCVINQNKLWASNLNSFNDPYEGLIWIDKNWLIHNDKMYEAAQRQREKDELPRQSRKDYKNRILQDCKRYNGSVPYFPFNSIPHGVICFFREYNDHRKWGHYANGQRGVCVRFRTINKLHGIIKKSEEMTTIAGYYNDETGKTCSKFLWNNIRYLPKPLFIDSAWEVHCTKIYNKLTYRNIALRENFTKLEIMLLFDQLTTKGEQWQYEQECRAAFFGVSGHILIPNFVEPETEKPYLTIDALILGVKIDKGVDGIIYKLLRNSLQPKSKIKLKQTKLTENSYEIKLR